MGKRYEQVEVNYHLQPFIECVHCGEVSQVDEDGVYLKHLCRSCFKSNRYTPHDAIEKSVILIERLKQNSDTEQFDTLNELLAEISSFKTIW
ncbi:MAG: hypothetical protein DRQ35_01740 [Gammaproteobacteria bacterium]|nr:MAG: hypothetical protein DRQ35_01740 [Gammaproteobacteria bacterium]